MCIPWDHSGQTWWRVGIKTAVNMQKCALAAKSVVKTGWHLYWHRCWWALCKKMWVYHGKDGQHAYLEIVVDRLDKELERWSVHYRRRVWECLMLHMSARFSAWYSALADFTFSAGVNHCLFPTSLLRPPGQSPRPFWTQVSSLLRSWMCPWDCKSSSYRRYCKFFTAQVHFCSQGVMIWKCLTRC